jgi:hypothetical protein
VVDSNKQAANKVTLDSLSAERGTIVARIQELRQQAAAAAPAASLKDELDQKTARLAAINNQLNDAQRSLAPQPSQGIALDLLTDVNGVSLYRFQMLAWTLVLVVVFLWHVYTQLAMPELDTTLLALMGISNGTYVGFKVPEKQA